MEVKDQGIKLFGKKIALPEDEGIEEYSRSENSKSSDSYGNSPKTPTIGEVSATLKSRNNPIDNTKTLKKPDKILPCPRCNSMDTKFCYYNNYNINQPRHYCKSCQRYWTAGGTMRNVPVGAGRRKNKFTSGFSHVSVSNPVPYVPPVKTNATVLSFSSDGPLSVTQNSGGAPYVPWPIPIVPAPYWSYNMNMCSSNLGKHSREGELINGSKIEQKTPGSTILVPKTLRIDDLDEAAKSSIWETLGIKNDCSNRGGLFKSFERKGDEKSHLKSATSPALQANPAAMSRSLNFQERA